MSSGIHSLALLSAGACKGLFQVLYPQLARTAKFGAVGAMRELLLAGHACDILVLTAPMLEQLSVQGFVDKDTIRPIGATGTGVAVPADTRNSPRMDSTEMLAANFLASSAVHFPDGERSTAGIHFMRMLHELELDKHLRERLYSYPNGAAAMAQLGKNEARFGHLQIGCTQVSEILYTPSVRLLGELPAPYVLRTTYCAALTVGSSNNLAARSALENLCGPASELLRASAGFTKV